MKSVTLGISFAALVIVSTVVSVQAQEESTKLDLMTDYLFQGLPNGVAGVSKWPAGRQFRLHVTVDGRGGNGKLVIDPNLHDFNDFGDYAGATKIGITEIEVLVQRFQPDTQEQQAISDETAKGRRIYELKGDELTCRVFLVLSPHEDRHNRLVLSGISQPAAQRGGEDVDKSLPKQPIVSGYPYGVEYVFQLHPIENAKASFPAETQEKSTNLSLFTDYVSPGVRGVTSKWPMGRRFRLNVAFDEKGGNGKLETDPNSLGFFDFGDLVHSTQIGIQVINVTLNRVQPDTPEKQASFDAAAKGRRLYEVKGNELTCRAFLVVSPQETCPHRLILKGNLQSGAPPGAGRGGGGGPGGFGGGPNRGFSGGGSFGGGSRGNSPGGSGRGIFDNTRPQQPGVTRPEPPAVEANPVGVVFVFLLRAATNPK